MRTFRTPNFSGESAVILHRRDDNVRRLERHLDRCGIKSTVTWPDYNISDSPVDMVFYDGDNGYDGLFPWPMGQPPMPLIALISSEAPGRLEWILAQETSAHLIKPIQSSGVFSTLVIAYANFERRNAFLSHARDLEARIAQRPVVFSALLKVMDCGGLDNADAFAIIRSAAMSKRQSIEDYCAHLDRRATMALVEKNTSDKGRA
jgi:AmiR/NasT family two-component response regulator